MDEVKNLIATADKLLFNIEVKGDNVSLMDRARTLLKKAYDAVEKAEKEEE